MTKAEARKAFIQKRKNLTPNESSRLDDLLLIRFQQWPLPDIQTLMSYWPITERLEVNTHIMADYVSFRIPGLQLAFPVMNMQDHLLTPYAVDEETAFTLNRFGIAEPDSGRQIPPSEIDAVFVPLLAFDKNGYRVGYGKGFYDRFLGLCRNDTFKIGFSHFDPLESIDDINQFDVPLNICITPNSIYEF